MGLDLNRVLELAEPHSHEKADSGYVKLTYREETVPSHSEDMVETGRSEARSFPI